MGLSILQIVLLSILTLGSISLITYLILLPPPPLIIPAVIHAKPQCELEGEDVFNEHVLDNNAAIVPDNTSIDCDTCNTHVYKDIGGTCYPYAYDTGYNTANGVQVNMSVCTVMNNTTACPVKTPRQK